MCGFCFRFRLKTTTHSILLLLGGTTTDGQKGLLYGAGLDVQFPHGYH